jgi:Family of unknown function (DUF6325)
VSEAIDELGAVDWLVLEFPGSKFNGGIAPVISELTDRALIRVLDLLVVKKDPDGSFEAIEMEDLEDSELGELRAYESGFAMILGEPDLADIATVIEPGRTAAVLVWENKWSAPFGAAVRHARWPARRLGDHPKPGGVGGPAGRRPRTTRGRNPGRSLTCL